MYKWLSKISQFFLILVLITSWVFAGWPQIYNFPPKIQEAHAIVDTFTTAGTFTDAWTAPADVFFVTAETWGGGGGSGGGTVKSGPGGSGGGGGAYAKKVISVTPGLTYTYVVGAAGLASGGTAGGNSSFTGDAAVQSLACGGTSGADDGGAAGAGGTIACSDGIAEFAGGAGAAGAGTSGGGGGESAGTTATGGSAVGTAGGTGTDGTDGSAGQVVNIVGVAGANPGAGAGGAGGRSGGAKVGAAGGVGQVRLTHVPITAALTGTVTASITEADIVAGGKTIILTVTGDTWVLDDGTFAAQRQNIINGIDSAQAEGTGWDAEVKAKEVVGAVVRTSATAVTITLTAQAGYNITATETITAIIPATALVAGAAITATPTFDITAVSDASITFLTSTDIFSSITPGSPVFATSTLSIDTNKTTGWNVTVSRDDADTTIDLDTNALVNIIDQTAWVPGAATTTAGNAARISSLINSGDVLAFRVMTASGTPSFFSTSWWGDTDEYIDSATTLWAGFDSSEREIGNSSVSSGGSAVLNTVLYYLDVSSTQPTGAYSGGITYTAYMNP